MTTAEDRIRSGGPSGAQIDLRDLPESECVVRASCLNEILRGQGPLAVTERGLHICGAHVQGWDGVAR